MRAYMSTIHDWSITGAEGESILGNTHVPDHAALGSLLIAHGFKGYKDYGFFPYLAAEASRRRLTAHRFNFSHSGMTNRIDTFERADLFESDTWGKQIHDMLAVATAVRHGRLPGNDARQAMIWFGHSRGGVTALLAASRTARRGDLDAPSGVVVAASPDTPMRLDAAQASALRQQGWLESPSSRTGQLLRIGRDSLLEVEADPEAFDPLLAVRQVACPMLMLHGDEDQTVPPNASKRLAQEAEDRGQLRIIHGASHTFNAPNPMLADTEPPEETKQMVDAVCKFAMGICANGR